MKKIFTFILVLSAFVIQSSAQGLKINEVDYDQPGTDSSEYIELFNSSSSPIDLGTYRVILYNGNVASPAVYDSFPLPSQMLNAGAYFVICGSAGLVPNCDMTRAAATNMIQNGSPDAIAIRDTVTSAIIDAVSYEGDCLTPYVEGTGVPMAQSDTGNTPYVGISRFPDGTDTDDNSVDFNRACSTPGTANVNTSTGCLSPLSVKTITIKTGFEVYPNPSRGIVNIEVNGNQFKYASVSVTDLLGNDVKKASFKNSDSNCQVNLSDLQDGIYFVKVKSDAGDFMKRVVLKK